MMPAQSDHSIVSKEIKDILRDSDTLRAASCTDYPSGFILIVLWEHGYSQKRARKNNKLKMYLFYNIFKIGDQLFGRDFLDVSRKTGTHTETS